MLSPLYPQLKATPATAVALPKESTFHTTQAPASPTYKVPEASKVMNPSPPPKFGLLEKVVMVPEEASTLRITLFNASAMKRLLAASTITDWGPKSSAEI